jgi:hypothetical protein
LRPLIDEWAGYKRASGGFPDQISLVDRRATLIAYRLDCTI